jgi:hypothetical protein
MINTLYITRCNNYIKYHPLEVCEEGIAFTCEYAAECHVFFYFHAKLNPFLCHGMLQHLRGALWQRIWHLSLKVVLPSLELITQQWKVWYLFPFVFLMAMSIFSLCTRQLPKNIWSCLSKLRPRFVWCLLVRGILGLLLWEFTVTCVYAHRDMDGWKLGI